MAYNNGHHFVQRGKEICCNYFQHFLVVFHHLKMKARKIQTLPFIFVPSPCLLSRYLQYSRIPNIVARPSRSGVPNLGPHLVTLIIYC